MRVSNEGEDDVARAGLAHRLVEEITLIVRLAWAPKGNLPQSHGGRSDSADPPITHSSRRPCALRSAAAESL